MDDYMVDCLESRVEWDGGIYGRYIVGSFKLGEGVTIATTLRRALLSQLPGIALTAVHVDGVEHEYSTMRGIRESVLDITSNLKEVVLAGRLPPPAPCQSFQGLFGHLDVTGPTTVRGKDIKLPPGLRCVNPEQYIATLTQDGTLRMKVLISAGKNYLLHTSARNKELWAHHLLPIDANFLPIRKVNFLLRPDYRGETLREQILLEIWSNGSLDPLSGVRLAAKSVSRLFTPFEKIRTKGYCGGIALPPLGRGGTPRQGAGRAGGGLYYHSKRLRGNLADLGTLDLSVKTYTYLRRKNIHTVRQLLSMTPHVRRLVPKEIALELETLFLRSINKAVS